ncbi:MAG: DUF2520 domain-containing protein [Planctomycetes bacterium]|nr:DUF2520 domain-containing protein [Planctomycetota bacterium]
MGYLLNHSGKYKVVGVWDRKLNNARQATRFIGNGARIYRDKAAAVQPADIIFITTPDGAIQDVCRAIFSGGRIYRDKIVIHCSGSQPSDILKSAMQHHNVHIASLHPMQTFANKPETVRSFKGTYCAYEGQRKAMPIVRNIISALGGKPVEIKAKDKTLYHIGCVFASNYLVTLIKASQDFMRKCEFKDKDILQAIRPLVDSSIKNIMTIGPASALTGPISRGDVLTIKNHLKAIRKNMRHYLPLYRELGRHTVWIALDKKSINKSQGRRLKRGLR